MPHQASLWECLQLHLMPIKHQLVNIISMKANHFGSSPARLHLTEMLGPTQWTCITICTDKRFPSKEEKNSSGWTWARLARKSHWILACSCFSHSKCWLERRRYKPQFGASNSSLTERQPTPLVGKVATNARQCKLSPKLAQFKPERTVYSVLTCFNCFLPDFGLFQTRQHCTASYASREALFGCCCL